MCVYRQIFLLNLYNIRFCSIHGKGLTTHNIRYRVIDTNFCALLFLGGFLHTEAGWKRSVLPQAKEIKNFLQCTTMEQKYGIQKRWVSVLLVWASLRSAHTTSENQGKSVVKF